jgi:hypothetical protein
MMTRFTRSVSLMPRMLMIVDRRATAMTQTGKGISGASVERLVAVSRQMTIGMKK